MLEIVMIVESSADERTAVTLAERVLLEKVDWLEPELLQNMIRWSGLKPDTHCSYWKNINNIMKWARDSDLSIPKFRGHSKTGPSKADRAASMKILNLIRILQHKCSRQIGAVIFIRDLDSQPERREGIEQARFQDAEKQPLLNIIIGTPDKMREAWVLNGFIPITAAEEKILGEIRNNLTFDPCTESHRLRSNSFEEPDRSRNPKVVLKQLTQDQWLREKQCWEETDLAILRERGHKTGLTAYLKEIEQRLIPIIYGDSSHS